MNGVDSSILVYALDPETKEHETARDVVLSLQVLAVNPTVVHEVYHTLVFKRGMIPRDAKSKVKAIVGDRRTRFFNITRSISLYSLDMASEFNMGGRDALIVGCYAANGVDSVLTHDTGLLALGKVSFKGRQVSFRDPLA
ncbi:MAG: PIN domain-containing protein [Nitrososphaerota archaeon]|nr:PIN domain-containing protein [Nitrososphaerota archaeon]